MTNVNFNEAFQLALAAFREAVQRQDFPVAQQQLETVSNMVSQSWPALAASERDAVHGDFMAVLQWARVSVGINRGQLRSETERVEGAKIYQMPNPRTRWNVQG